MIAQTPTLGQHNKLRSPNNHNDYNPCAITCTNYDWKGSKYIEVQSKFRVTLSATFQAAGALRTLGPRFVTSPPKQDPVKAQLHVFQAPSSWLIQAFMAALAFRRAVAHTPVISSLSHQALCLLVVQLVVILPQLHSVLRCTRITVGRSQGRVHSLFNPS